MKWLYNKEYYFTRDILLIKAQIYSMNWNRYLNERTTKGWVIQT